MRKAENLPTSCAVVTKSGNLNFLEPSGPLQACNGTALPAFIKSKKEILSKGSEQNLGVDDLHKHSTASSSVRTVLTSRFHFAAAGS